jgi:hypothetical protein
MNVSDLHPEDLLDREAEGELSPNERAMLDAHLSHCVACRLEREVRADFAAELADDMPEPMRASSGGVLVKRALESRPAPARLVPEQAEQPRLAPKQSVLAPEQSVLAPEQSVLAPEQPAPVREELASDLQDQQDLPPAVRFMPRGSRFQRRFGAAVIAAAVLMLASVAVAAGGTRVWAAIFTPAPEETATPALSAAVPPAPKKKSAGHHSKAVQAPAPNEAQESNTTDSEGADSRTDGNDQAGQIAGQVLAPPTACAPVPLPAPPPAPPAAPPVLPLAHATRVSAPLSQYGQNGLGVNDNAPVASPANAMFSDANNARRSGDHATAVKLYRDLLDKHGTAPEAGPGRLALARMLLDDGDAASALPLFDRYLGDGGGELREEAMVGRARSFEKLGRTDDERAAWKVLLASYPQSVHTAHAEARLAELKAR